MLNKGSSKKVTLICYRAGVMTFSLATVSRFYPTGQISSPWGEGDRGWVLKTNDAASPQMLLDQSG